MERFTNFARASAISSSGFSEGADAIDAAPDALVALRAVSAAEAPNKRRACAWSQRILIHTDYLRTCSKAILFKAYRNAERFFATVCVISPNSFRYSQSIAARNVLPTFVGWLKLPLSFEGMEIPLSAGTFASKFRLKSGLPARCGRPEENIRPHSGAAGRRSHPLSWNRPGSIARRLQPEKRDAGERASSLKQARHDLRAPIRHGGLAARRCRQFLRCRRVVAGRGRGRLQGRRAGCRHNRFRGSHRC